MTLLRLLSLVGIAMGIITFLVFGTLARADDFSGLVVGISDGDTISAMHGGRAEKIRLCCLLDRAQRV